MDAERHPGRRRRRAALAAAGALLVVPLWALPAGAHASLRSSEPAEGERLDAAPARVVLDFTEAPEPAFTEVQVLDADGAVVSEEPEAAAGEPERVAVPLADLDRGVYTVSWRVVSAVDGHATAGAFAFGVGEDPSGAALAMPQEPRHAPRTSWWELAGRWLLFLGLGMVIGAGWVGALAFDRPPRAVLVLAAVGAATAVGGLAALAAGQASAAEVGIVALVPTAIGRSLLARAAAIAVVLVAAGAALRFRPRVLLGVAATAAAAAMLVHVVAGHAGAPGGTPAMKIGAQWVHVVAGGVWLGGLAALLLGVRGDPDESRARAVRRFSTAAGVALFAVLGTGTLRSLNEIPSWAALWSSLYGRLALAKIALLVSLAGLGAINRYRNVSRADRSLAALRRVSRGELALAVAAVGVAAVMASVEPRPHEAPAAAAGSELTASGTDFADTVEVRLAVTPGAVGPNRFELQATDPATGEPIEAERVSLRFAYLGGASVGESELDLEAGHEHGDGYAGQGGNLSVAGRWRVTVLVQQAAGAVEIPLEIATPCGTTAIPSSAGPTLYDAPIAGGTAQMYVDPGRPGANEVHVTYFDPDGAELPVEEDPTITAVADDGTEVDLEPRRLSPGHLVAPAELDPGLWRFEFAASTEKGTAQQACFEQTIGEDG